MFILKHVFYLSITGVLILKSQGIYANSLEKMNDDQLASTTAQALLSLSYIAPTDGLNLETRRTNGDQSIGFYKLGMEADLELNTNIRSLQLGCGGVNGANDCDINIDNISLSGISDTNVGRASSSAKITNPFIEFAIKNSGNAATREVVGLRLSAEKIIGLMTLGNENSAVPNGINSFSGYLKVQSGIGNTVAEQSKIKGYANTASQYMNLANYPITGNLVALSLANAGFITNGGGFNIPEMNNLPFETAQIVVNGTRRKSVSLTSSVNIPMINLGTGTNFPVAGRTTSDANGSTTGVFTAGNPVNARVTSCSNTVVFIPACIFANNRQFTNIRMTGTISGATANISLEEALGFIHRLEINSSAALSLQQQAILWPGSETANIAQPGWWLALQDPTNIGRVQPTQKLSIEPLLSQVAQRASTYLQANPATTNDWYGILTGNALDVNLGNINLSTAPRLMMNLSNLQLEGQSFVPNCFGNLKFC